MVTLSGRTPYVPDDEQVEFAVEISDNAFALIMDEKRKGESFEQALRRVFQSLASRTIN
ncbi:MAG: hypothetical protein ABWZ80_01295 [Beijerinckiaceae bacterium]